MCICISSRLRVRMRVHAGVRKEKMCKLDTAMESSVRNWRYSLLLYKSNTKLTGTIASAFLYFTFYPYTLTFKEIHTEVVTARRLFFVNFDSLEYTI